MAVMARCVAFEFRGTPFASKWSQHTSSFFSARASATTRIVVLRRRTKKDGCGSHAIAKEISVELFKEGSCTKPSPEWSPTTSGGEPTWLITMMPASSAASNKSDGKQKWAYETSHSLRELYDILPPPRKKEKYLSDFVQQKYTRSKLTPLGHIPRWQIKLDFCC